MKAIAIILMLCLGTPVISQTYAHDVDLELPPPPVPYPNGSGGN